MKVGVGLIVKDLNYDVNILKFLENATKYNHHIEEVIIAYGRSFDVELKKEIEQYAPLKLIKINQATALKRDLRKLGLAKEEVESLIYSENYDKYGLIPYGKNRNNVVLRAILDGLDILFFIDDDVEPCVLIDNNGKVQKVEIDFFKEHLDYLQGDIYVTTSDYSGYYIVPPMKYPKMEYLIRGVQKGAIFKKSFANASGLTLDKYDKRQVFKTDKILGGNLAIRLEIFDEILPFFSDVYSLKGESFLTRGEDTLLGLSINKIPNKYFLDIDVKIFHNTFGDYPRVPDILSEDRIKDRFFYACTGWIGRNPFLNWLLDRDLKDYYKRTRKALTVGVGATVEYLEDERFFILPEALDAAYENLENMILNYYKLRNIWKKFIELKKKEEVIEDESTCNQSFSTRRLG